MYLLLNLFLKYLKTLTMGKITLNFKVFNNLKRKSPGQFLVNTLTYLNINQSVCQCEQSK